MRKILITLILLLFATAFATVARAQSITTTVCPGAGCIDISVAGQASIGLQITGTWAGTITFRGSVDGVTFVPVLFSPSDNSTPVSTTTANGVWARGVAGYTTIRVVFTTYTSGTAVVRRRLSTLASTGSSGGLDNVTANTSSPLTGNGTGGDPITLASGFQVIRTPLPMPGAPSVVVQGTPGSTVYHYQIVAKNASGTTPAGRFSTTTNGAATLNGTDFNRLTWSAVTGAASYDVYRIEGGPSLGKIATSLVALTLDDTGLAGDTTEPPTVDTTGSHVPGSMYQAVRWLTDTQIKAQASLVVIIPAQGANTIIVPAIYGGIVSFQTVAYTNVHDNPNFGFLQNGWGVVTFTNIHSLLTFGVDTFMPLTPANYAALEGTTGADELAVFVNQPIEIYIENALGNLTGGNPANALIVSVTYLVLNTLTGQFQ